MEKQGDEELVGLAASVAVPLSVAASGSPTIVTSDSNGGPSLGDETSVPGYDIRERSRDTGRDRGLDRSRDRRGTHRRIPRSAGAACKETGRGLTIQLRPKIVGRAVRSAAMNHGNDAPTTER